MTPKNLRSVVGQANRVMRSRTMESRRNFRSYRVSDDEWGTSWLLTRGVGVAIGCYLSTFYCGDHVGKLEDERLELVRLYGGEKEDLRENLVLYNTEKMVFNLRDKLLSGLRSVANKF